MSPINDTNSVDAILDFVIEKEEGAVQFYLEWSKKVERESIGKVLEGFAEEEKKHKALITDVKNGKKIAPTQEGIANLKISDYLADVEPSGDMDYQNALMVAMQREKAAFKLYSDLGKAASDGNVKNLFLALAEEEAKHKLRLEIIYDEEILADN